MALSDIELKCEPDYYRYRVVFEFRNDLGEWVETYLDGCGEGLCEDDAVKLVREMIYQGKRNVRYEEV